MPVLPTWPCAPMPSHDTARRSASYLAPLNKRCPYEPDAVCKTTGELWCPRLLVLCEAADLVLSGPTHALPGSNRPQERSPAVLAPRPDIANTVQAMPATIERQNHDASSPRVQVSCQMPQRACAPDSPPACCDVCLEHSHCPSPIAHPLSPATHAGDDCQRWHVQRPAGVSRKPCSLQRGVGQLTPLLNAGCRQRRTSSLALGPSSHTMQPGRRLQLRLFLCPFLSFAGGFCTSVWC